MPLHFIFQPDNDTKHSSRLVPDRLQDNIVRILLAQFLNLNPIKNTWEVVERRIRITRFLISNR